MTVLHIIISSCNIPNFSFMSDQLNSLWAKYVPLSNIFQPPKERPWSKSFITSTCPKMWWRVMSGEGLVSRLSRVGDVMTRKRGGCCVGAPRPLLQVVVEEAQTGGFWVACVCQSPRLTVSEPKYKFQLLITQNNCPSTLILTLILMRQFKFPVLFFFKSEHWQADHPSLALLVVGERDGPWCVCVKRWVGTLC